MWFPTPVDTIAGAVPPWAAVLLLVLSYVGSVYLIVPATVLGYYYDPHHRRNDWPAAVIGAYALMVAAKPLIDAPRPTADPPLSLEDLPELLHPVWELAIGLETGGFPSGHAVATVAFWGLVVMDVDWRDRATRLALASVVVVLVGVARVALATHFIIDVLGGYLLGMALLGVVIWIRRQTSRPAVVVTALAGVLAVLAIVFGRVTDGVVLLGAAGVAGLVTTDTAA